MKIRKDAVNGNSYADTVLVLFSDMNPGKEIYIMIARDDEKFNDIREVADAAYGEWYAADYANNFEFMDAYHDAIGSYISTKLCNAGYKEYEDYLMFFGPGFDEDDQRR